MTCMEFMRCGQSYLNEPGSIFSGFDGEVLTNPMWEDTCERLRAPSADKPLIVGGTVHEWRLFDAWHAGLSYAGAAGIEVGYPGRFETHKVEENFFLEYLKGYAGSPSEVQECARKKLYDMYSDVPKEKCTLCGSIVNPDAPLIEMVSQMAFGVAPQIYAVEPGGVRYRYLFDMGEESAMTGTTHDADIDYLATEQSDGIPRSCQLSKEVCLRTAQMLRQYWSSFAKTGVPTSALGPVWEPVDSSAGFLGLPLLVEGPNPAMSHSAWFNNETAAVLSSMACRKLEVQSSEDGTQCTFKAGHQEWPRLDQASLAVDKLTDASVPRGESIWGQQTTIIVAVSGILLFSVTMSLWLASLRVKTQHRSSAGYRLLMS